MDDLDNLKPSAAVKSSFQPIMKAIDTVRAQLVDVRDVVAVRPGYKYPPAGKPAAAIVVATTPGTAPVQEAELEQKFGVPFAVIDATRICSISANLGDTKTIITHPASTSHGRLTEEQRLSAGITQGLVRVAMGLEDVEDIQNDLNIGLSALTR